jgi:hypothetical protein
LSATRKFARARAGSGSTASRKSAYMARYMRECCP